MQDSLVTTISFQAVIKNIQKKQCGGEALKGKTRSGD
ncbi:hypothetical protein BT93_L3233 [Corymbia citriodora subsp. variegata]|uniref:Uncharacterized protein n=1 Tax=Corymbia citriodora subsp. variegata TaxID=360336 RepID=A0A8T0CHQ5_CORYI|nr:hypothetical protein BT93_L3233 [Corymbia citriodora subsp. variegata]